MARCGREHQPSHGRGILRDPGAKRHGQLGEGDATNPRADRGRSRGDEPKLRAGMSANVEIDTGRERHATRIPHLRSRRTAGPAPPVATRRDRRGRAAEPRDHHVGDHARDDHAGRRHDDRQRRVALHAGQHVSATQDQISWVLTSYIVSAAIMMPMTGILGGDARPQEACSSRPSPALPLTSMLCGMAHDARADGALSFAAGRVRRAAGADVAIGAPRYPTRARSTARRWRCGVWA